MKDSVHEGHRERLKARFIKHGLSSFEPHQVLELLLFYAIPRKDTNPIAHELLDTFGSLTAVLEAPVRDLCKVNGISEHSATLIRLGGELLKRYEEELQANVKSFSNIEEIAAYLKPHFRGETKEKALMLCLNNRNELLNCCVLSIGGIVNTDASLREIVEQCVKYQTTRIVLAHNHPAGNTAPSPDDITTTRKVIESLRILEVSVIDHLIFARDGYLSMRQTPHFAPLFSGMLDRLDRLNQ